MKTYIPKKDDIQRKWYVVDATDVVLGRLSTEVASILRGKNKPMFTPNADVGDYVIVINAEKVKLTGKKLQQKELRHYTGYAGGLKSITYKDLMQKDPERAVTHAIVGMLPHNSLGRQMAKKLRVYRGADHDHIAQNPEVLEIK